MGRSRCSALLTVPAWWVPALVLTAIALTVFSLARSSRGDGER